MIPNKYFDQNSSKTPQQLFLFQKESVDGKKWKLMNKVSICPSP
jgi:hypothetical protein